MILAVPLLYRFIYVDSSDYVAHLRFAKQMWETHSAPQPHFLFHLTVGALQQPLTALGLSQAGDYRLSALITCLACTAAAAALIQSMIQHWCNLFSRMVVAVLTVTVLLVTPFPLFAGLDRKLYIGYLGINIYHNPTILMLKPFAIALFWISVNAFTRQNNYAVPSRLLIIAGTSLLTSLTALAKPSYLICLVPAICSYLVLLRNKQRRADTPLLVLGIVIPATLTLLWQVRFAYDGTASSNSIVFAPLQAMAVLSGTYGRLLMFPKLVVASAFPLMVLYSYPTAAAKDTALALAWITFGFGALWTYLFGESARMADMNFAWSGQMSLFVLFLASTLFLISQHRHHTNEPREVSRFRRCALLYGVHVASGVGYAASILTLGKWL
jgi:hypothetical protein